MKRNPESWKWRLVLWLTGGEIEAVPLLPHRPVYREETAVIKLGLEGAYNTVEVRMPEITELVETTIDQLAPDTFVAIDITAARLALMPEGTPSRIVGTVVKVDPRYVTILLVGRENASLVERSVIDHVYWAPAGYRA